MNWAIVSLLACSTRSKWDEKSKFHKQAFLDTQKNLKIFMLFEPRLKMYKSVYDSTHSHDYLWRLILRGKQKNKTETHTNTKFLPIVQIVGTMTWNLNYIKLKKFVAQI